MQDSKFSCLVFVSFEKQRFGDANFSGGEIILIGKFLLLDHGDITYPPLEAPEEKVGGNITTTDFAF